MSYLNFLAQNIEAATLTLLKRNYDIYTAEVSVSCQIQGDWTADTPGILFLTFTVPDNAPMWDNLFLNNSHIDFYKTETYPAISVKLSILQTLGYQPWTPGQSYTVKLCFQPLKGYNVEEEGTAYLSTLANILNQVILDIETLDGELYFYELEATATVIRDIIGGYIGVVKIDFTVPSDAPVWGNIRKNMSLITIRGEYENYDFIRMKFTALEDLGYTSWTPGGSFTIRVIIPSLRFE